MPAAGRPRIKDPELYEALREDGGYDGGTVPESKRRAKEIGLAGHSRQGKDELIAALRNS